MGIVQLIDPFYVDLPEDIYLRTPTVGQICWVVTAHPYRIPIIADVERIDPTEHFATRFHLRPMTEADYKIKQRLPLKFLALRSTEELLFQRSSLRPAVVVATGMTIFADVEKMLRATGRKHLQEESILVVPLYGIEGEDHLGGFPAAMVARIRALMYRQFFFLPRENSPLWFDSVARLDRLEVAFPESSRGVRSPAYKPTQKALSPDAVGCLLAMLRQLFGSDREEQLEAAKAIVQEALPEDARIPQ